MTSKEMQWHNCTVEKGHFNFETLTNHALLVRQEYIQVVPDAFRYGFEWVSTQCHVRVIIVDYV